MGSLNSPSDFRIHLQNFTQKVGRCSADGCCTAEQQQQQQQLMAGKQRVVCNSTNFLVAFL